MEAQRTDSSAPYRVLAKLRPHGLPRVLPPVLARHMQGQHERNLGSIKGLIEG